MGGGEGGLLVVEHAHLFLLEKGADLRTTVEVVAQLLVDGLKHPVFGLFVALLLEVAGFFDILEVAVDHVPHLVDVELEVAGICHHLGAPLARRGREEMKRVAELRSRQVGTLYVVAVGLVDRNAVGHLHDAALYALELVAGTCQLYEQEEVYHGVYGSLRLAYADGLDKDVVVSGGLAEHDCLSGLTSHTAERSGRG